MNDHTRPEDTRGKLPKPTSAVHNEICALFLLFARGTALMLSVGALLVTASGLGGVISERLDVFNHFIPIWAGLGLVSALASRCFSRGLERVVIVTSGLTALGICTCAVLPELWQAVALRPNPTLPSSLKLIQFNTWESNNDPIRTVRWILSQKADVVIIEEAGSEKGPIMQGLRGSYPFASCRKGRRCDAVIFSRRRQVSSGTERVDDPVASITWAKLDDPVSAFTIIGVHQPWPLPAGPQEIQADRLAWISSRAHRESTIVAGDFNSTPWSFALRRLDGRLRMRRWTRAFASWPSGQFSRVMAAPFPFLAIDHVYTGRQWYPVSLGRGPALGSDHRPLIITLHRTK